MSETTFEFGDGRLVVQEGTYGGKPAVFITPSKTIGVIGSDASDQNIPIDRRVDGDCVLTFPTDAQAKTVSDALCNARSSPNAKLVEAAKGMRDEAKWFLAASLDDNISIDERNKFKRAIDTLSATLKEAGLG